MIGYSDEVRMDELLAPLRRLEPVTLRNRRRAWRPVVAIVVAVVALAGAGVAIADGFGAFDGISAAQHTPVGSAVLPPAVLAQVERMNTQAAEQNGSSTAGFQIPLLLPDTARVLGTAPDGSKVYGLTNTKGDLCVIGGMGGSCGPPLSRSHPITMGAGNPGRGPLTIAGVAIDGVTSISFTVWGEAVTVPVRHNVYQYEKAHSTADGARCIVAHFADGSTVNAFPEVPCP